MHECIHIYIMHCIHTHTHICSSATPSPNNLNMPTKMARVSREKAVLVTVYVEKPRRKRRVSSDQQQQHHHHLHHHHYVHYTKEEVNEHKHGDANKGYNRRAELLRYSQRLRESAQPPAAIPSQPKPISSHNQQSKTQIVPVQRKPRYARTPTCPGNWKILIPNVLSSMTSFKAKKESKKKKKSGSTTNKMKAIMKSLEVQKKKGFISKLFSTLRKHK